MCDAMVPRGLDSGEPPGFSPRMLFATVITIRIARTVIPECPAALQL